MFHLAPVILTLTIVVLTLAAPFGPVRAQGTKGEHDACRGDVARLCRHVRPPDQMLILECLKSNRERLSRGCNKVLEEHGQ